MQCNYTGYASILSWLKMINKFKKHYILCQNFYSSVFGLFFRYLYFRLRNKNIDISRSLRIGMKKVSFIHKYDRTFLNILGILIIIGACSIERDCILDIEKKAVAVFENTAINANTTFIIMHDIKIRDNKIMISNNVWIGSHGRVLKESHMPDGYVIASGSVVTKVFIKENILIAGNPAIIIRKDISWS